MEFVRIMIDMKRSARMHVRQWLKVRSRINLSSEATRDDPVSNAANNSISPSFPRRAGSLGCSR